MSNGIQRWTPIQEGRFHLRSMRDGESITAYVIRMYPSRRERRANRRRISMLIQMARRELREILKQRKQLATA